MSHDRRLERDIRSWLQEGPTALPDRVLDDVLAGIETTGQRRRAWSIGGPFGLSGPTLIAAAVVLAMVILGAFTAGERIGDAIRPPPDPDSTRTILSFASLPAGPIEAGTYVIDAIFPVTFAFAVPEGWSKVGLGSDHAVIDNHPGGTAERPPSNGVSLGFFIVDGVFADPCAADLRMLDPPVGPTVSDLADAFRDVPALRASAPVPTTIDGYAGERLDLDLLLYMCPRSQAQLWRSPAGWVRQPSAEDERNRLWILDVEGQRLVVNATTYPGTTDEDLDELQAIIESIDFIVPGSDPSDG